MCCAIWRRRTTSVSLALDPARISQSSVCSGKSCAELTRCLIRHRLEFSSWSSIFLSLLNPRIRKGLVPVGRVRSFSIAWSSIISLHSTLAERLRSLCRILAPCFRGIMRKSQCQRRGNLKIVPVAFGPVDVHIAFPNGSCRLVYTQR